MSRGPRGAIPSPAPSRRKPAKRGCMALATSCSLVGRSSHASLVRDHVERLECGAGLDGLDAAERVAQQLFEMFRLHLAACPEHHFPEFEVATEWPGVVPFVVELRVANSRSPLRSGSMLRHVSNHAVGRSQRSPGHRPGAADRE